MRERVATCLRHGCLHTLALTHRPCVTWADIWHTFWAAFNSLICDTWPTLCTLRSPPSCERAEWRVHAVRCRSCPLCALHVQLVCFPVLTCCSLTRAASNVSYRIAAISHGLLFCFLFLLILIFWLAFCGLTSATRQPIVLVLWVWGADSLRASLLGVAACGDMWPTGGACWSLIWACCLYQVGLF